MASLAGQMFLFSLLCAHMPLPPRKKEVWVTKLDHGHHSHPCSCTAAKAELQQPPLFLHRCKG